MQEHLQATVEKASKNDADFMAVASTGAEDRHGEIVSVDGWDISNFKKNPVLLWAHNHDIPAVGVATKVWVEGKGKRAKLMIEGKLNEATELARGLKELVKDGVIRTMSVGFRVMEMDDNTFTKQELLEVSFVNVPANSQAMITAYKSLKGKNISDETYKEIGIDKTIAEEVLSLRDEIKELRVIKTEAKTAHPVAPYGRSVVEKRQMRLKAIARASNQLISQNDGGLPREKRERLLQIIKRANEQLIVENKEFLKNG